MKNIAFGQYYPAESVIHRLDPRAKIVMMVLYIVCSMVCKNIVAFAVLTVSAVVIVLMSRIPMGTILRSIRPILFIMLFTVVLNVFWTTGELLLLEWGIIKIYVEGIYKAVFMMVRIVSMIVVTGILLTYTTTPISLTDALEETGIGEVVGDGITLAVEVKLARGVCAALVFTRHVSKVAAEGVAVAGDIRR